MYFGITHGALYRPDRLQKLRAKAAQAAAELGLDYEYRFAGYGEFAGFIQFAASGGHEKTFKKIAPLE